jgi:hypothetical protein
MKPRIATIVVNDEEWHVRRIEGMFYHRRPHRTVWLPGIPPESTVEQVDDAFSKIKDQIVAK